MRVWPPSRSEIAASFDARADTYDRSAMHRWVAARTVAELGPVHPPPTVVDVAVGTGLAARALLEHVPSARVVAVDVAVDLLRVARTNPRIDVVCADVEQLPLGDRCADVLTCVSAAAYFAHPARALGEFRRVLRPGGVLLVQTWRRDGLTVPRALRAAARRAGVSLPDPNGRLGTRHDLVRALTGAGFVAPTVREDVWRARWPDDMGAVWRQHLAGPLGAPLVLLPDAARRAVEKAFYDQFRTVRDRDSRDSQPLLIARAHRGS